MRLNHINLCVADVKQTRFFFETYFGFACTEEKGDGIIAILKGEDDFLLVLSKLRESDTAAYPQDFHVGFMQQTQQQVLDIYNALKAGGIAVEREPKKIRDSYGFYFIAPGGLTVEVASPL